MAKEQKTNAMRILDKNKIDYTVNTYECDEFVDGVTVADLLGQPYESSFKTLVAVGKSGGHFVFVLPIAEEVDLKAAARAVDEKAVELIHVKDLQKVTGYSRGGRIGAQIFIAPQDLVRVTRAKVADIIRHDAP